MKSKAGCPWAILMQEKQAPTHSPTSPIMQKAREATFKGWPHEKERGFAGKAKKMAKAGWHFTPSTESIDSVECIYCKVELDGWEPKDDPMKEHESRAKNLNCAFFSGIPALNAVESIFAMAKSAFANERAQHQDDEIESVIASSVVSETTKRKGRKVAKSAQVTDDDSVLEKKKPGRKKLPVARAKKAALTSGDLSVDDFDGPKAIPINLQSARKKRLSPEPIDSSVADSPPMSPVQVKKPRLSRLRSSSTQCVTSYADCEGSPEFERSKSSAVKGQGKRARTPLEEINELDVQTRNDKKFALDVPIKEGDERVGIQVMQELSSMDDLTRSGSKSGVQKENVKPPNRNGKKASLMNRTEQEHDHIIRYEDPIGITNLSELSPIEVNSAQPAGKHGDMEGRTSMKGLASSSHSNNMLNIVGVNEEYILSQSGTGRAARVSSTGSNRRASSRRGSKTITSHNIEDIVQIKSPSRPSTSRSSSRKRLYNTLVEAANEQDPGSTTDGPVPTRRTSSRRRGSAASTNGHIEEIIMLDHKARPRPQRVSRTRSTSVKPTLSSDSAKLLEDEEGEEERRSPSIAETIAAANKQSAINLQPLPLVSEAVEPSDAETSDEESNIVSEALAPSIIELSSSRPVSTIATSAGIESVSDDLTTSQELKASPQDTDDVPVLQELAMTAQDNTEVESNVMQELESAALETIASSLKNSPSAKNLILLTDLTTVEKEMTIEEWLRHRASLEAQKLGDDCERMIEGLQEKGRQSRAAIAAA